MKELLEIIYYLSGIVLAIGVLIGMIQLKITQKQIALLNKDYKTKNKRAVIESSIKYLEVAKSLIVDMSDYRRRFVKEIPNRADTSSLFNKDFMLDDEEKILNKKELVIELIVQEKLGLVHILNELEVFSVAMLNGVADENIVFTPFGRVFCEFIEEEHLKLTFSRTTGTPYENLVKLYNIWKDRLEVQSYELQIQEAKDKIKAREGNHNIQTPIGF